MTNAIAPHLRQHPLLFAAIVLAVFARVLFWLYTDRVWEDALITLTPARNAWEGNGLTHHASEPRVHSFTSPVSVLIPLAGESIGQGLLLLRLTALGAAIATIVFAYRLCVHFSFPWPATLLVLSYLALDQLHIFFGMSGMETQIAVAVMLGAVYALAKERWLLLGAAIGLGLLTRPEFVFVAAVVGVYLLALRWRAAIPTALAALAIATPWFLFAHHYYDSPVPNTIRAKTWGGRLGLLTASPEQMFSYIRSSWRHVAPFEQWVFAYGAPVPESVLFGIVAAVLVLAACGIGWGARTGASALLVSAVVLVVFIAYRSAAVINPYFMWYLPPFTALLFLLAGAGVGVLHRRSQIGSASVALVISAAYCMHIPFTWPVDKTVQVEIDSGVRSRIGEYLNLVMGPSDSVVLEPLGYIGFAAFNKTTYDFPGLSSPRVVDAIRRLPEVRMGGVIKELKPSHLVLRPIELAEFAEHFPVEASNYVPIARFQARPGLSLERFGYKCYVADKEFFIYQRVLPAVEHPVPTLDM